MYVLIVLRKWMGVIFSWHRPTNHYIDPDQGGVQLQACYLQGQRQTFIGKVIVSEDYC